MSDAVLFGIGCGVFFLFLAGSYLVARERFTQTSDNDKQNLNHNVQSANPLKVMSNS